MAEIAFAWERQIPFWAWTIVPYWTLNLFYALGFFLCRTRSELRRYTAQLLLAQAIAFRDPVTGQAAWYDVRVRIRPAAEGEPEETWPRAEPVPAAPGTVAAVPRVRAYFAGREKRP